MPSLLGPILGIENYLASSWLVYPIAFVPSPPMIDFPPALPSPIIGRGFYGSLFNPFWFGGSSPMSRWGDDWYAYDKLEAGATLLSWGDAITDTDPWLLPFVWNRTQWQQNWYLNPFQTPPIG